MVGEGQAGKWRVVKKVGEVVGGRNFPVTSMFLLLF